MNETMDLYKRIDVGVGKAPASAGWWRVVSKPTVWAHCAPDTNSAHISIHCYGKLLAMTQMRYDACAPGAF